MLFVRRPLLAAGWWALFVVVLIGIACLHNPIFNPCTSALLFLLILGWKCTLVTFPSLDDDAPLMTPKNGVLFIWLCKLVIIPAEILWVGNHISFSETVSSIALECSIILTSFVFFALGWHYSPLFPSQAFWHSFPHPARYGWLYLLIGFTSIVLFYGSFSSYWTGALFTYTTHEAIENLKGNFIGVLANIGQRFGFWGIVLLWYSYNVRQSRRLKWFEHLVFLLLAFALTFSSNRANMAFPILAFLGVILVYFQPKRKWIFKVLGIGLIFLVLFYGHLRVQPSLDTEQVALLFDHYTDADNNYLEYASQLYLGSPYQLSPLLSVENPPFTLVASLLEPVPVLGKAFREESGPFLYNSLINNLQAQDKVIPVAGELYLNGGMLLVAIGHFLIGIIYRWLDRLFQKYRFTNPPLAAAYFYLSTLFGATLLLSLTVLSQFVLFNAAPALLIITINWWQMRKGYST